MTRVGNFSALKGFRSGGGRGGRRRATALQMGIASALTAFAVTAAAGEMSGASDWLSEILVAELPTGDAAAASIQLAAAEVPASDEAGTLWLSDVLLGPRRTAVESAVEALPARVELALGESPRAYPEAGPLWLSDLLLGPRPPAEDRPTAIADAESEPEDVPARVQLASSDETAPGYLQVAEAHVPEMSPEAQETEYDSGAFGSDPTYKDKPYDAEGQIEIYGGKYRLDEPRPVVEIGRRLYTEGPFEEGVNVLGEKNLGFAHLQAYGDLRTAIAYNDNGAVEKGLIATRLNLDVDLGLTATERIHAFLRPFDENGRFSSYEFAGDDSPSERIRLDGEFETLFFEGDVASIYAGLTGDYPKFDLPFTFGLVPYVFQNGIWVEDAFWGGAFSLPARNSPFLDISNFDVTFFAGFDEVTTPAVQAFGNAANHNVSVYGTALFAEAFEGYIEAGYGYTDGRASFDDFSYHNVTAAFTRRYGGWLSNSMRVVGAFGQDLDNGEQESAEGVIFLLENSLITSKPLTLVPYFNAWFGLDRPVPLAREDGILKNTGINFETDGLTGFPKLDDSGQDTFGGALGVEYLFNLDQQIVVELAGLQVMGGDSGRPAADDQYAVGLRYQIPLTNAWILRADAMYGLLTNADDIAGVRMELRLKF